MKKIAQFILIISIIIVNTIITYSKSYKLVENQPFTMIELKENDNYTEGFQRLSKIIKNCKGIDSKVTAIKQVTVKDHPEIQSHYKVTLESDIKWVNGHWIVDLVPYTKENMSITKAHEYNDTYKWWYVYYANGKPEAVAWARYGN